VTEPSPSPESRRTGRLGRRIVGPFTLGHIALLGATLAVAAIVLVLLTTPVGSPAATGGPLPGASFYVIGPPTEGLAIGQVAPELAGERDGQPVTLTDLDGRRVSLAALRGHPVWVNFWASWCPPCQQETPVLRDLYEAHHDEGLQMVAVSVQEASPDEVRRYVETYGLPYTVAFDATSAVFQAWRGYGLPTHYLLDADGVVRAVHYGPLSREGAEELLTAIMPPASPSPSGSPAGSPAPTLSPGAPPPSGAGRFPVTTGSP
jgi:cytochrome c biogenesis protein CcmG, thiol:disulfide interchange protein DsbE